MEMAGEILGQLLAACVGTAAFSALFGVPKKYWLDCGICGAVGWGVYLAVMAAYQTPIIGTFAASAVLTMLSRCMAIQRKAPTILFLVCGIFPLVPGAAIYYTAYNFFMGQERWRSSMACIQSRWRSQSGWGSERHIRFRDICLDGSGR